MRMSCNGCRVLRKGCSENCSIRPCLQWIKTPESQANATVFLAKFYGRAGLLNLINAGPEHLRPAIFRSLLYEACGRILNPIYGSVGLLWSGSWQRCQVAVEAVLKGVPITPINSEAAATERGPPLKAYDIRHLSKDKNSTAASNDAKRIKTRTRFKPKNAAKKGTGLRADEPEEPTAWAGCCTAEKEVADRTTSHESSLSHQSEETPNVAAAAPTAAEGESKETESVVSVETADTSILFRDELESTIKRTDRADDEGGDVALELRLGFEPISRAPHVVVPMKKRRLEFNQFKDYGGGSAENGLCKMMKLGLEYPASA